MTALSEYFNRVREENPGLDLEFEDGTTVTLRPVALLNDVETRQLRNSYKILESYDERDDKNDSVDPSEVRSEIVSLLSGVSTEKARTAQELDKLPLGVLVKVFEDWGGAGSEDAPKSESGDSAPDEAREPVDG